MNLSDAVAVVTGGASGIGRATAELLAVEGARPVTWDLAGADVSCDVSSVDSVEAAIRQTKEAFGVPTVLVACAGVGRVGRIIDLSVEDWDLTYAVNVRGVFLSLRVVAREMAAAGLPGSVVLLSSVNGWLADSAHSMYSTSKAAVSHLARCAAVELGQSGIRVNAIAAGPTDTPMMSKVLAIEGYRQQIADTTPLGRIAAPEDIAQAIINVVRSDWVTGQVVAVDGGSSLMTARGHDRARGLAERALRMASANEGATLVLPDRFRDAMRQVAAPVCVVTSLNDSGPHGTTVSAFASLSMNPPMVMLSLDNESRLLGRVALGARLGVNILAAEQRELASRFAGKGENKFDGVQWFAQSAAPRLAGCHAWVAIDTRRIVPGGDHMVIMGEVVEAETGVSRLPLTYHDRKFGTHREL